MFNHLIFRNNFADCAKTGMKSTNICVEFIVEKEGSKKNYGMDVASLGCGYSVFSSLISIVETFLVSAPSPIT